jgi:hypothetical protein
MATRRNRIIYQSQALFIGPSSTGYHLQTGNYPIATYFPATAATASSTSRDDTYSLAWTGVAENVTGIADTIGNWAADSAANAAWIYNNVNMTAGKTVAARTLIEPLNRIQSANFNFTINRQDVNEFGQLARLDSIVMESPTVGLDFNYYLTDGGNERKMGFNVPTSADDLAVGRAAAQSFWTGDGCMSGFSALSGLLNDPQGNNFFITVVPDGKDVQGTTPISSTTDFDVVAIGNGFVSDYTVEASVGAIPTASVTVEAFNIKVEDHLSGQIAGGVHLDPGVPGVDLDGNSGSNRFCFQTGMGNTGSWYDQANNGTPFNTTGDIGIAALRPGDLTLTMSDSGSYIGLNQMSGDGSAHIQSFTISVPLSRTILQRLGSTFGYARVVDLPLDVSCTISAVVSDLKKNNLFSNLSSTQKHTFTLKMDDTAGKQRIKYIVKNARLDSETFSNSIGDNESVDMTFTAQIGGANDQNAGLFMEGSYNRFRTLPYWPMGATKDDDSAYKGTPVWLT